MYYLQSRYYDQNVGRFVNSDDVDYIGTTKTSVSYDIFTYCGNNIVLSADRTGYWFYNLNDYYHSHGWFIKMLRKRRYENINGRYIYNRKLFLNYLNGQKSKYIYNQNAMYIKNMEYGKSNSKLTDVGCELIAVYNALKKIGKTKMLHSIICEFELNGLAWLNGRFGTKPENLQYFFIAHSIKYSMYTSKSSFVKKAKKSKVCIMSFWNSNPPWNGLHTIAFYYKNKKWHSFNRFSNSSYVSEETYNSFNGLLNGRAFIRGYCF